MSLRDAARARAVVKGPESRFVRAMRATDPDTRADVLDCVFGAAEGEYPWTIAAEEVAVALDAKITEGILRHWWSTATEPYPWDADA